MSTQKTTRMKRAEAFKNLGDAAQTAQVLSSLNYEAEHLRQQQTQLDGRLAALESALAGLTATVAAGVSDAASAPDLAAPAPGASA